MVSIYKNASSQKTVAMRLEASRHRWHISMGAVEGGMKNDPGGAWIIEESYDVGVGTSKIDVGNFA